MSHDFTPKVVTANALLKGDAIWLTEDDRWTRNIAEAELIEDEAHATIRLLHGQSEPDVAVGVYLADAAPSPDGPTTTHFREAFRTRGPSNYAHGKQVDL